MQNEIEVNPEIVSAETNFIPDVEKYNSGNIVPFVSIDKQNIEDVNTLFYSEAVFNPDYCDMRFEYYPEINQYPGYDSGSYFDYEQYYTDVPISNLSECSNVNYVQNENSADMIKNLEKTNREYLNRIENLEIENENILREVSCSKNTIKRNYLEYELLRSENEKLKRENRKLKDEVDRINDEANNLQNLKRSFQRECERKESLIRSFKKKMPFRGSSYKRTRMNNEESQERRDKIQYSNSCLKIGEENESRFESDIHYKRRKIVYDD